MVGEFLLEPDTDFLVGQDLSSANLGEALLDFADEPVVVVNGSLDGFPYQKVGRNAAAASRPRQLPLKVRREIHFHRASVPAGEKCQQRGPEPVTQTSRASATGAQPPPRSCRSDHTRGNVVRAFKDKSCPRGTPEERVL